MALFSKSMVELMRLSGGKSAEEVEADFNWFMGHNGIVRGLRTRKLIAVPTMSVNTNPTDAQVQREVYGAALSLFCHCLSDDEAVERFKEAKTDVLKVRMLCADNGIAKTAPIVRLYDPAWHLSYNMKIAGRHIGPCVDGLMYMHDWGYDGKVTERDGGSSCLIFGAPFLVPNSDWKTKAEHLRLLEQITKSLGLSFPLILGSAALGSLVMQSHLYATGDRLPASELSARTISVSDGYCLLLRWGDNDLHCGGFEWLDSDIDSSIGCLALGVKKVKNR